jgi:cell wall-associated NlpC family hydrolase
MDGDESAMNRRRVNGANSYSLTTINTLLTSENTPYYELGWITAERAPTLARRPSLLRRPRTGGVYVPTQIRYNGADATGYLGGGLMRRLIIVLSALVFASVLISLASLSVEARAASEQYATEDATQQETTTPGPSSEPSASGARGSLSDGSAGDLPSQGTFTNGATAGPNEPSLVADTPPSASESDDAVVTARGRGSGNKVVRAAKRYIGTKYRYGACSRSRMSCTCLTKKVFAKFHHKLSMSERGQWNYKRGHKVQKSHLRPGDIVFFKEGGRKRGITHVGIYSGRGNLVHASAYFGKVVESKMKYIKGYSGAKRLR